MSTFANIYKQKICKSFSVQFSCDVSPSPSCEVSSVETSAQVQVVTSRSTTAWGRSRVPFAAATAGSFKGAFAAATATATAATYNYNYVMCLCLCIVI